MQTNTPEYSVSELSDALRRTLEDRFARVRVRGEISGLKRAASGHIYLALKDADALLQAIIWKGAAAKLGLKPEDGMEVAAIGRLTTYPGRSSYQLVIERLELAGRGALLALIEERKRKLTAEGLFDPARKKRLPFLPERIGVVTSPTGAVIRDILHRLADRFPRPVLVWPCLVQGEGAAEQIAAAIAGFNALPLEGPVRRPDLLIVARGGGSAEDLMAFNEEVVVRAAAASAIPLISAVGHETDVTLIDFAADARAPTPTAAAEMATPVRAELRARVQESGRRLTGAVSGALERLQLRLDGLARGLPDPAAQARLAAQRLDEWGERLTAAARAQLTARQGAAAALGARLPHPRAQIAVARERLAAFSLGRLQSLVERRATEESQRLASLGRLLESCSYRGTLARGFVVVRDGEGRPLTQAATAQAAGRLRLEFADGEVAAQTAMGDAPAPPPVSGPVKAAGARARRRPSGQGELF